jgi:hypothetical protein
LYAVNAFAHWITGIDIIVLMPKLTPIFGGLSVLVFYFLVYELIGSKKIAIASSLLLSVLPFHVYQLSHASPLTIGHFFMVSSLYFFVKSRRKTSYVLPLFISTILLIMSHHLTTYFYVISLIFILFFENAGQKEWTTSFKYDFAYIFSTSILVFAYWAFIATTVHNSFINQGFSMFGIRLQSIYLIAFFYILFFTSIGISKLVYKFNKWLENAITDVKNRVIELLLIIIWKINPFVKKDEPTIKSRIILFILIMIIFLSSMFYFMDKPLPWTNFAFTIESIILATPLLVIFAFVAVGFRFTAHIKNGFFIRGWLFALILSFLYGLISNSKIIYPHRHFEYLMYPCAIISIFGIGAIFSDPYHKSLFLNLRKKISLTVLYRSLEKKITQKKRILHALIIGILVISLAGSSYSSHKALEASDERITLEDLAALEWIYENLNKNHSMIASDHRLARMAESQGFNTTKDETRWLWNSENLSEYVDELMGIGKNHTRITHLIVDDIMRDEVVHVGFAKIVFMTNETWTGGYDKFSKQPFMLVYRNETFDISTNKTIHWAEVYEVNWRYIENSFLT